MACPFFLPQKPMENPPWPHPARLPLGGGWTGQCTAPGHEAVQPSEQEIKNGCNLGYARACSRLPRERRCDAVRFALLRDRDHKLSVQYVCEIGHAPAEHGVLEFDVAAQRWKSAHGDARIQKMAECYLESYLQRSGSLQSSAKPADD